MAQSRRAAAPARSAAQHAARRRACGQDRRRRARPVQRQTAIASAESWRVARLFPSPRRGEGGEPSGLAFGKPKGELREPGEGRSALHFLASRVPWIGAQFSVSHFATKAIETGPQEQKGKRATKAAQPRLRNRRWSFGGAWITQGMRQDQVTDVNGSVARMTSVALATEDATATHPVPSRKYRKNTDINTGIKNWRKNGNQNRLCCVAFHAPHRRQDK